MTTYLTAFGTLLLALCRQSELSRVCPSFAFLWRSFACSVFPTVVVFFATQTNALLRSRPLTVKLQWIGEADFSPLREVGFPKPGDSTVHTPRDEGRWSQGEQ